MKRTTVALDVAILRKLKQQAAAEDRTLADVINDLLRAALSQRTSPATRPRLELPTFQTAPAPGVNIADRDQLFEIMEAGHQKTFK